MTLHAAACLALRPKVSELSVQIHKDSSSFFQMPERSSSRLRAAALARPTYRESSGDESTDEDDIIVADRGDGNASSEDDDSSAGGEDEGEDDNDEDTSSVDTKDGDDRKIAATKAQSKKRPFVDGEPGDDCPLSDEESSNKAQEQNEVGGTIAGGSDPDLSATSKVCPHCNKQFSTSSRLRYHWEKRVCRKEGEASADQSKNRPVSPPAAAAKKKKKKKSGSKKRKSKAKFRGNQEDRTCPRCKRVFTSLLGFQYHRGKPRRRAPQYHSITTIRSLLISCFHLSFIL
jgi:C2H2-type zinc finger